MPSEIAETQSSTDVSSSLKRVDSLTSTTHSTALASHTPSTPSLFYNAPSAHIFTPEENCAKKSQPT